MHPRLRTLWPLMPSDSCSLTPHCLPPWGWSPSHPCTQTHLPSLVSLGLYLPQSLPTHFWTPLCHYCRCCVCFFFAFVFHQEGNQFRVWDHIFGKCPRRAQGRKHGDMVGPSIRMCRRAYGEQSRLGIPCQEEEEEEEEECRRVGRLSQSCRDLCR